MYRYTDAIDKLKSALKTEGEEREIVQKIKIQMCSAHSKVSSAHCHINHTPFNQLGDYNEGIRWCDEAIAMDTDNTDILCDKAELYINNEEYEEAIKVYQQASNINNQNQRVRNTCTYTCNDVKISNFLNTITNSTHSNQVKDGLHRAQNLLKQSQKRDYYKILGVKRNANKKEINKAYRTLAKEWHPDKYEGEDKKKAEKMFYDIAAAKEVLTDKGKGYGQFKCLILIINYIQCKDVSLL